MFTEERIGEIIHQLDILRYPQKVSLPNWRMQLRSGESKPKPDDQAGQWSDIPENGVWGGHCEYFSFRGEVTIPPEFEGKIVEFSLLTGKEGQWDATNPQFTVYIDGVLRQGFDVNHNAIRLTDCAVPNQTYNIYLSAFTGVQNFHLIFDAKLQTVDTKVNDFYYDLLIPWQTACLLETDSQNYLEIMPVMVKAVNMLDLRKPGSAAYYDSIQAASRLLKETYYTNEKESEATIACVGHTHIDIAWLWTLAVTQDKAVRSFSTVLELMRRYPEYIFMSSQPQLYQYVKKNAPGIFEQIKVRVAEGRWEPEGGMFVEPDCNLASGEALVRQFLYGKRFFKKEFDVENEILWLPDVFGYSAALPQIMKKCGIKYFMTTKISWNDCNKLPYDTFYWKGIDGTKVLSHFIPTRDYHSATRCGKTSKEHYTAFSTNYNGYINPSLMKGAWQRYQQKYLNKEVLCSYGHGDGGGGPTEEMLETQRRLAYGVPGCPKTKQSKAIDFYRRLEKEIDGKKVPIWSGELYLEYHRGTYTTMARNKKFNRRSEFELTNLESDAVMANALCNVAYPQQELNRNWEVLLRNQFHDILPGSAVEEVYKDSQKEYEGLLEFTRAEDNMRMQTIADHVGGTVVFNPNGQKMSGLVQLLDAEDRNNVQKCADGTALAWAENIPAKGYAVLEDKAPVCGVITISAEMIETPFARISLNQKGQIISWLDKTADRELLQLGKRANVLMTYEDKPHEFDNWNIYDYYREKSWPIDQLLKTEIVEMGPYRAGIKFTWKYQDSIIEETMYVYAFSARVDFKFQADWKEDQIFLKALFPLELNSTEATYEIQYGNVKRTTAVNTSWDEARFEVCYHKWMDLSEGGYGVSFLNDCKYGISVEENTVGLSLLRCGRYPNQMADREYHEAIYSVMPHEGTWKEAGTVQQAYLINNPMRAVKANGNGSLPRSYSQISADAGNIMIEAVKKAEDQQATVVRLYEFENKKTSTKIFLPKQVRMIWRCNMLEQREELMAENTDAFSLEVAPFEIVTLLIEDK